MKNMTDEEYVLMQELLDKMENILNSDEYMRGIDIVGDLSRIVEKKYDI